MPIIDFGRGQTLKQQVLFLILEKNKQKALNLSSKIQALGYATECTSSNSHSLLSSINKFKEQKIIILLAEETLQEFKTKEKQKILDLANQQVFIYIITKQRPNSPSYFEHGLSGFIETPVEAKCIMNLVRKSILPKNLLWQVTAAFSPVDSLSFIALSLDDLLNHNKIKFGHSGFSMQIEKTYHVGDRIHFSISFKEGSVAYMVEGLMVVRWSLRKEKWTGFEFETLHGSGQLVFIDWLTKHYPHGLIPLPFSA